MDLDNLELKGKKRKMFFLAYNLFSSDMYWLHIMQVHIPMKI